ncbi:MAG: hypothetical protein JWM18_2453 [Chloroflexi bacterium]|jgi:hypothetical protein|nr:hypothetical protein [Chloroflexota bacterium]
MKGGRCETTPAPAPVLRLRSARPPSADLRGGPATAPRADEAHVGHPLLGPDTLRCTAGAAPHHGHAATRRVDESAYRGAFMDVGDGLLAHAGGVSECVGVHGSALSVDRCVDEVTRPPARWAPRGETPGRALDGYPRSRCAVNCWQATLEEPRARHNCPSGLCTMVCTVPLRLDEASVRLGGHHQPVTTMLRRAEAATAPRLERGGPRLASEHADAGVQRLESSAWAAGRQASLLSGW